MLALLFGMVGEVVTIICKTGIPHDKNNHHMFFTYAYLRKRVYLTMHACLRKESGSVRLLGWAGVPRSGVECMYSNLPNQSRVDLSRATF